MSGGLRRWTLTSAVLAVLFAPAGAEAGPPTRGKTKPTASKGAKAQPAEKKGVAGSKAPTPAPTAAVPRDKKRGRNDPMLGRDYEPRAGEPGSGVPRDPVTSRDPKKLAAPLPTRPRNDAEAAGLEEIEGLARRYREAAKDTRATLRDLLLVEGVKGRKAASANYARQIREHEAKARTLRAKAVARYEAFLEKHPNDASWTPEIMFRLAELQFEAAGERFRRQEEAWEKAITALEEQRAAGKETGEDPPSPKPEYERSIELYRGVATRFPTYQYADASVYMMGILAYETEDFDGARQSYLALTCADKYPIPEPDGSNIISTRDFRVGDYRGCTPMNPDSKFLSEAWLRVGELHYDVDELRAALEAYEAAAEDKDGDWYHTALIRIAWTLYLRREFKNAVERFDEFIRYADAVKGTDKEGGAAEFRDSAVRYLAKCYYEDDWDLDGNRDRVSGRKRLDQDYGARKDPHVPEIYEALGQLMFETDEFKSAIAIWKYTLQKWPLARNAPQMQYNLMDAYSSLQQKKEATNARDLLATNFLRGTKWFVANELDTEAIEKAMRLAEDALVATALDHHSKAQELRAAGQDAAAKAEYQIAAKAYAAFLERFPDTPSSYEYRFNYADTLYFSDEFLPSAEQYAMVRDSNLDNRYQGDAAESVVAALEAYLEDEEDSGNFIMPKMPKEGDPGPFDPVDPPKIVQQLQEAYDTYTVIRPDTDDTAPFKFKAAALSQRYYQFAESEPRFERLIEEHCDDNVAIDAGYAIIDAWAVREDLAKIREWSEKLASKGCGSGEESAKFAGELKSIGNAVRFKEATILFEAGEFEAAADRYVALVKEAPDDPNSDRALNNAAVAYEKIGRFGSASQTYRMIYTNYPDSEFADDALLRTSLNHARFFEFEEAVRSYLTLAEDPRYEDSEHRLLALKNAANLLEQLQEYDRSAVLFRDYSEKAFEENEAAEAMFNAAVVTAKTGDSRKTIKAYQAYLAAHSDTPGESERVVGAWLAIGKAHRKNGDRKKAEEALRRTRTEFDDRKLTAATEAADIPSEAAFLLAEYSLERVMKNKLTGRGKKLTKQADQLFKDIEATGKEYEAVWEYRRLEWTLASMFRRGYGFEAFAQKVREAPVPKQLKAGSESYWAYKEIIDQAMTKFEDHAVMLYEETVKRSKQYKISTEWTDRARERLHVYKPEEYPLLRPAAVELQLEDRR